MEAELRGIVGVHGYDSISEVGGSALEAVLHEVG